MKKLARSVVLPLALVASVAACDKGKGGGGGGASGPTGAAGAAAVAPAKGGLNRALAAMPKDTEVILGIDIGKLRGSDLFKKYEPMLMQAIGDDLKKFKDTCGFDPMQKLSGVLIGGKGSGGDMSQGTIFVRGFERAATIECLKKHEAAQKAAGKPAKLTVDGDYVEFDAGDDVVAAEAPAAPPAADPAAPPAGDPSMAQDMAAPPPPPPPAAPVADPKETMRLLWVDDQTALLIKDGDATGGKDKLLAAAAAKDGDGLTGSKAFTDLLAKTHTGASMWFVAKGDSGMLKGAQMLSAKALYGSIDVGAGIAGEIRMWMNSADEAKSTTSELKKQLDQVKSSPFGGMVPDISVKAEAEDTVLRIKMSQSQLEQIVKMAKSMGGGF